MNILKALGAFSAAQNGETKDGDNAANEPAAEQKNTQTASASEPAAEPNMMAAVLARHEMISNRIRSSRKN